MEVKNDPEIKTRITSNTRNITVGNVPYEMFSYTTNVHISYNNIPHTSGYIYAESYNNIPFTTSYQNAFVSNFDNFGMFDDILSVLHSSLYEGDIKKDDSVRVTYTIKKFISNNNSECKKSEICVICQEQYKNEEELAVIGCCHEFHKECLNEWVKYKQECPVCRFRLEKINF